MQCVFFTTVWNFACYCTSGDSNDIGAGGGDIMLYHTEKRNNITCPWHITVWNEWALTSLEMWLSTKLIPCRYKNLQYYPSAKSKNNWRHQKQLLQKWYHLTTDVLFYWLMLLFSLRNGWESLVYSQTSYSFFVCKISVVD